MSLVPSCFGMMSVLMVKTASSTDSVPARMPHDSMPRCVFLTAYLRSEGGAVSMSDTHRRRSSDISTDTN